MCKYDNDVYFEKKSVRETNIVIYNVDTSNEILYNFYAPPADLLKIC